MARMGTAPGSSQHPAMPDPGKIISSSLSLLRRLGFNDEQALDLILTCAFQAKVRIQAQGNGDLEWVKRIVLVAATRRAGLHPSDSERTENDHADG